jgi:hypothetical protein
MPGVKRKAPDEAPAVASGSLTSLLSTFAEGDSTSSQAGA